MDLYAGLVRVSSVGGRSAATFQSDQDQVREVERYIAARGDRVIFMPPELDVSGGLPISKRPSLQLALDGCKAGVYQGIAVAYISRLTRSQSGRLIWELVESYGCKILSAREALDTSTAAGRFQRDIWLDVAVLERDTHGEQHAARRKTTVDKGIWRVRQVPKGYAFQGPPDEHDGKYKGLARRLVPGPDAELVRQAFRDRAAGVPLSQIAARLGMTASGVRQMLSNPVYIGHLSDGAKNPDENLRYLNTSAHEPLVTQAEFDAAQGGLPRPTRSSAFTGPALLAGIVRCAGCGHRLTRRTTTEPLYTCRVVHSGQRCPAPTSIFARLIDPYVEQLARAYLRQLVCQGTESKRIREAERDLELAQSKLDGLLFAVAEAGLQQRSYRAELYQREQAVLQADARLHREQATQAELPVLRQADQVWETLDAGKQNALLRVLLHAVVVRRAGIGQRPPLEERVRVLTKESDLPLLTTRRGDQGAGIEPIEFPDVGQPGVLV